MRLARISAASLVAALALGACGGGGDGAETTAGQATAGETAPSASPLALAASETKGVGSSRIDITSIVPAGPGQEPVTLAGEGAFDYASQQGRMTFDFGALLGSLGAGENETRAEILYDGTVVYLRIPLFSELFPGGKPWIKIDIAATAESQGLDLSQLTDASQADPTQVFAYLETASDVEEVGREEVRGEQTTHYRATLDLEAAAEAAPSELRERMQAGADQLRSAAGTTTMPIEVWIGDDGLVRRFVLRFSLAGTEPPAESETTMEFYDFGVEVSVEPPPASEVIELSELSEMLGGATQTTP